MTKDKKPRSLHEQIESISSSEGIDPHWEDHVEEVIRNFDALEPLGPFNLLDPESAKAAEVLFQSKLEELQRLSQQVRVVKAFAEQQKPAERKPFGKNEIQ